MPRVGEGNRPRGYGRVHASSERQVERPSEAQAEFQQHSETGHDVEAIDDPVLRFVRTDINNDEDDTQRLHRYLAAIGECIDDSKGREGGASKLVVSKKTNITALPSSYLKDLSLKLRNARYNITPFKGLKGLGSEHPPCMGSGEEVLLQGFNWDSCKQGGSGWYETLKNQVDDIADFGFTLIWMPPPTDSVSPEGYMPRDLYLLDSKYGTQQALVEVIQMFQSRGIKVLGDAVINHRCAHEQNEHGIWNQFGGAMRWDERAIVRDDRNFHGKGNSSTGEHFEAAPNIDHSQDFVKADIGEWLVWLRTTVGFDGWRFDFAKGFHGSHLKDYLEISKPYFSVGEYWDGLDYEWDGHPSKCQNRHRQRIVDWIKSTGSLSCAFDMTTKGILHGVFDKGDYERLVDNEGRPSGLMGYWPSRAVTFLENHDTGSSQGHWRFPHHALEQGYAYILTHPGTPCVFYDHIFHDEHLKHVIRRLIALRKEAKIDCRSKVEILECQTNLYAARIADTLIVKLGPRDFCPNLDHYKIADRGHAWAIWKAKDETDS